MHLLVTRPRYDNATHYLFCWMGRVLDILESHIVVKDIQKEKIDKKSVFSYIKKQSPTVIIFNGHGNEHSVLGDKDGDLVSTSDDLSIFKKKKVYIRSCKAGRILGPEIVKGGATGFIGYYEDFIFATDPDFFHNPINDELAGICLNPTDEIIKALLKGSSIREANDSGITAAQNKLNELQITSSYYSQFAPFLYWNMLNQVFYE